MKKTLLFSFALTLFFAAKAFSDTTLSFYIDKTGSDAYDVIVVVDIGTNVAIKGPAMAYYESAPFTYEFFSRTWHSGPKTFTEMKTFIAGKWYVQINYVLTQSIYSFSIADILQESDFLPNPIMIEPEQGADNMISQDCRAVWDPNGAQINAEKVWLWIEWGYDWPEISQTSDELPWLDIGEHSCKIGYCKSPPSGFMGPLQYVSGVDTAWDSSLAWLLSSDRHTFTVSSSIDFNGDYHIDFKDYALYCSPLDFQIDFEGLSVICRNWLEWGPPS